MFLEDGYQIVNLSSLGRSLAFEASDIAWHILGGLEDLDITPKQDEARQALKGHPRMIVQAEIDLFRELMGGDLHIQRLPYLRIARPGVATDNIGFHRDTWYGDSPYELSVWIPLTDTDELNALRVSPGSHIWPEYEKDELPAQAEKGSTKHSLGFLYAPKRMRRYVEMKPLPVRLGQMIVFSLSLLHGQEVNMSTKTRVSLDVRVANSLAPIQWTRSKSDYYQCLCTSPVTEQARKYYRANAA